MGREVVENGMTLILDGIPLNDAHLPEGATVGHAVDLAKGRLAGTGKLILAILCDGAEVDAARLRGVMASDYSFFKRVEMVSGSPYAAVTEALQQARAAFGDSFATIKQVTAWLSAGDIQAAMRGLSECVEAWSDMHEAVVQGGALAGVDFDRLVIGGRHVLDWLGELSKRLRDIRDAIQSRDHVSLGDVLKYEMDETLQGWEVMLDGFIRHVEKMGAGTAERAFAGT
ncbi:MAG: hypothetical protein IPK83_14865 [Planctomycetes bacterium]|nr:hypothetical protein [Planctomycetota bacterium]